MTQKFPQTVTIDKNIQLILKNFQGINREIVFNPEETSIVSPYGNLIAICKSFTMPIRFGLTNLKRLLFALRWADTDQIKIYEDHIFVENLNNPSERQKKTQKLHFHEPELLAYIDANYMDLLPLKPACRFELTAQDIKDIKDANKNLENGENPVRITISNNTLSIVIGESRPNLLGDTCAIVRDIDSGEQDIELIYSSNDFVFVDGDYECFMYSGEYSGTAVFKLKPIKVSDEEEIDLELFYMLTTGLGE